MSAGGPLRARLGFLIPSSNRMVEPQMQRYTPPGVVPHFARVGMTNRHRAPLDVLLPRILDAAVLLGDAKCDLTVFQCTGTSMSGGMTGEAHAVAEIARVTGRPAISTASAVRAALEALAAKRLIFISETGPEGHAKKAAYLREAGYTIAADKAAGLAGSDVYCSTPAPFWRDTATAFRGAKADAMFISCANIAAIEVIADVEAALGIPVVTSNQAALWHALRTLGLSDRIAALGRLFAH